MIDENQLEKLTYYWSESAKKDKLYIAIRVNDAAGIERLRAEGAALSEHIKGMLKNGGGSLVNPNEYGMDWYDFSYGLGNYTPEEFIAVIRNLRAELGEPIYYSDTAGASVPEFYRADVFRCVLDCFNNKKITKKWVLRHIIDNNMTELLETAADHGWFKLAKKCDEYIEYAREKNRVECAAWLADYKNRAFDAAKEREKAEKRQNAELNAAPDSVTALKALWKYKKREDGTVVITGYKGIQSEIIVPERIGKSAVEEIGDWAFSPWGLSEERKHALEAITKITLPSTLKRIGQYAFCRISALEEINIPDGVAVIEDGAFDTCFKLPKINIPASVTEIGKRAFYCCSALERVTVPQGITLIKDETFGYCTGLISAEIPDTVRSIGVRAFSCCKSLEAVIVPSGVTEISEGVFSGCEKLVRVELPDTLVKIGKYAFSGCAALKALVIPEGVREIGDVAFSKCAALERIVLPASLEKAKNYTQKGISPKTMFDNSPNVTAAVAPKSYAEKYCKRNGIPFVYS